MTTTQRPLSVPPLQHLEPVEAELLHIDTGHLAIRLRPWYLRLRAGYYLLFGDFVAFCLAALVTSTPTWEQPLRFAALVTALRLGGLYKSRLTLSPLNDLPYVLRAVLGCELFTAAVSELFDGHVRLVGLLWQLVALAVVLFAARAFAYAAIHSARRRGIVRHTAIIVGAGHVGIRLAETLRQSRDYGVDVVGFIDDRPRIDDHVDLPAPLLGGYDDLSEVLDDFGTRLVIVAFGSLPESQLIDLLRICDRMKSEIMFVPRLFEVHSTTRDLDEIRGVPLVRVRRAPYRSPSWKAKRLLDILFAATALVVLSPVLALCALAVRRDGGAGILFKQERVGIDGRPFHILKFRSMKPQDSDEAKTQWNIANDSRVSRTGRFLRRTSMDELPQLLNILRGDMSVVGPRPERPHFVNQFSEHIPRYMSRHRVPAGLTGWAQVNGLRGDTSIEDRARFDNYYVENWSLWGDLKIIARTVAQVVRRQGG
jgi:exopolysaccharide biosynthesis polyprenyl glycosylphosphotransferase